MSGFPREVTGHAGAALAAVETVGGAGGAALNASVTAFVSAYDASNDASNVDLLHLIVGDGDGGAHAVVGSEDAVVTLRELYVAEVHTDAGSSAFFCVRAGQRAAAALNLGMVVAVGLVLMLGTAMISRDADRLIVHALHRVMEVMGLVISDIDGKGEGGGGGDEQVDRRSADRATQGAIRGAGAGASGGSGGSPRHARGGRSRAGSAFDGGDGGSRRNGDAPQHLVGMLAALDERAEGHARENQALRVRMETALIQVGGCARARVDVCVCVCVRV